MTRPRQSQERRDGESWYRVTDSVGDGGAEILIYDEIGWFGITASDFIQDLAALGSGPITVRINSGGGDVFDAYAIYNSLISRPGVTTVVDSLAASAASVIAMAGEQRLMARTSQMMIHDAGVGVQGNADDLQAMVERLQTVSGQIAGIYADTAGGEPDYWRGLMRAETWFTPQQALDAGLITGITGTAREPAKQAATASLPAGAIVAASTSEPPEPWDPDGDGDDDSTAEGDTDNSHWAPDGTQIQSVPGLPLPGQPPVVDSAAVDQTAWDATKAWANGAASDDPAAFYAGICAGEKAGDKATQAAWALPYKYHPGDPPNAEGTRNALSRLGQTEGLTNEAEARATLEAAMKKVNPDYESSQSRLRVPIPGNERNGIMPAEQDAMTVEARRSRIVDIDDRVTEIASQYPSSVLPTPIQNEWDQLVGERNDHQAALVAVDARNQVLATVHSARLGALEGVAIPPASAIGAPAVHVQRDIYDLAEIRNRAHNAEDMPRLFRENAIRAIDVASFPGSKREDTQQRVIDLLDTVREDNPGTLARRILATGSPGYKKAFGRALATGNPGALGQADARILALGESDTGSYAVPFELDPTVLLTSNGAINPLRQISRVVQITSKEYDLVTSTGVTVSRQAEATPATDNSPTLAQPTVKPERVDGFIPFSVELEGDWSALQAEMMALLADAKDVEEANSFTLGNGTPPAAGGIIGTLNSSSDVTGGGGTGALGAGDPQLLEEALAPRFRTNASFMGSKTTLNAYRTLLIAAGYTYDAYVQATQGTPKQLFGYNAYECSDMVSTHAAADTPLIFGDFKRGFLIVDRVGMNMELVPTLFRQATAGAGVGMPTGQRGYFAWWRNNSRVLIDNAFRLLKVSS